MNVEELKTLWDKTTLKTGKNYDWDCLIVEPDGHVCVPTGSHLGETLILLFQDYEGAGCDCLFISELIKLFVKEIRKYEVVKGSK